MSVTINGTNGLVFNDASTQNTSPFPGGLAFRNRIINGACMIDQRNAGASVTITDTSNATYTLDRWFGYGTQASKFSVQQNAGSVTPPTGFKNYIGITSLSAYSVGSTDSYSLGQNIEGLNVADLNWGSANAASVTLSFWVRSSLTGTFGGSLRNSAANRSYPFSYTISSANTWEQKSVTIAGDTSGTWQTDNGVGIRVQFGLGQGSTVSGTAGSWAGANYNNATGATSVVGTSGATFYITGVQLEKGSTATSFDYRPYGTELALCQRYYTKAYDMSVVPGTANPTGNYGLIEGSVGAANNTSLKSITVTLPVAMRSDPTITPYDIAGNINKASADLIGSYTSNQAAIAYNVGERSFGMYMNTGVSCGTLAFFYTAVSEL